MTTSEKEREHGKGEEKQKDPALYCGNFPPELKERCESIAGALRISITKFVAEILDDETRELKGSYEAIMRWYAVRLDARIKAQDASLPSSPARARAVSSKRGR